MTTTYDEFLLFKGLAAWDETDKDKKWCKSSHGNNKLIQDVSDHFDCKMSSQNELKQTHSMVVILTQEHETVEKLLRALKFILIWKFPNSTIPSPKEPLIAEIRSDVKDSTVISSSKSSIVT